jgi:hypothetical protein
MAEDVFDSSAEGHFAVECAEGSASDGSLTIRATTHISV